MLANIIEAIYVADGSLAPFVVPYNILYIAEILFFTLRSIRVTFNVSLNACTYINVYSIHIFRTTYIYVCAFYKKNRQIYEYTKRTVLQDYLEI